MGVCTRVARSQTEQLYVGSMREDPEPGARCRAAQARESAVQADKRSRVAWERAERAQAYLDAAVAAIRALDVLPAVDDETPRRDPRSPAPAN